MFVSAVVPVFNSINTLERAINSLLIQPEINEIFIVDDGSTDGSYKLAIEIEKKISILNVLKHPNGENRGASASRNLGLNHSKNIWIQFLDADDELKVNKISNQMKLVDYDVPFIVGNCFFYSGDNKKKRMFFTDIWNGVLFTRLGDTCSNLWNKNYILEAGYWNEELINSQDYDLIFRLLKLSINIKFEDSISTNVYKTSNSISTSKFNLESKLNNFLNCRNEVKEYLILKNEFTISRNYYYSAYVGTIKRNYPQFFFHHKYSVTLFIIYKIIKSLKDRLVLLNGD